MKRKLSLVLALVMLISLLPNAFATSATEPFEHTYVFSQAGFNTDKMITTNTAFDSTPVLREANGAMYFTQMFDWSYEVPSEYSSDGASFMALDTTEDDGDAKKTDKWKFVASRNFGAGTHVLSGGTYYEALRAQMTANPFQPQYVIYSLNVEAAGQYTLQFRGSGSVIYPAVYFIREGTSGVITTAQETYPADSFVGYVNPNTPEYTAANTVDVPEAGNYLLAFQFDTESAARSEVSTQGINLAGVKLVPVVEDEIISVSASAESDTLIIGDTTAVSVSAKWTVSGDVSVDAEDVTFTSSDNAIATVDANGTVTALAEGVATITATLKDDAEKSATVTIEVTAVPTTREYEYIFSQAGFNTDKMITTNTAFDSTPVLREANSAMYFREMFDWNYVVASEYSKTGEEFKALDTTTSDGDAKLTDKWTFVHSRDISATAHILSSAFKFEAPITHIDDTASSPYAVFRLNVDATGYYAISLRGASGTSVYPSVYFFREGMSGVSNTNTDSYPESAKLGYFDSNSTDYVNIGAIDITEAGNYILAFVFDNHSKELNPDTADQHLYLSGAKLSPSQHDELTGIEIATNKGSIAVGKSATITAKTIWSVSGEKDEEASALTYSSSDNAIATVDENGVVTGVAEGEVTITATLKEDTSMTDTVDIAVIVPPAAHSHEFVFSQAGFNTDKMITTADYSDKPVIREANNALYLKEMFDWSYEVPAEYSSDGAPFMALDTTEDDGDARLTDKWEYVYSRDIMASAHILPSAFKFEAPLSHISDAASSPYAVFRVEVGAPGDYILQLRGANGTSVYPAVYFFADGMSGVSSTNKDTYPADSKLGYFDSASEDYVGIGKVSADEAGSYILAFHFDNTSKELNSITESQHLLLSGAKLVPESENVIESFEVTADKTQVTIGKSAQLTANMVWSVLGAEALEPSDVTFTSSDDAIATVDENGVVTGVAEGVATITATLKADSATTDTIELSVVTPQAARIYEYVTSYAGMNSEKMTTSDVDFGNIPVIRPANNSVYFLTMLHWDYEVPEEFTKDGVPFMALDTTEDDGDAKLTDKWAFVAGRPGYGLSSMFIDSSSLRSQFRPSEYGQVANYIALKVFVDAPGEYILQTRAAATASGAVPATYFFPESASGYAINNPATYPEGSKLEYFDSSKNSEYNFVGNVTIDDVGSYIVVFATDEESARRNVATDNLGIPFQWFNISGLRLVPADMDYLKSLAVEAETDIIYYGESLTLDVSEVWEYAGKKEIAYDELIIESSDDAIATVSENGVVTPHTEGDAIITVTMKDNPEVSGEFKVSVYDPDAENLGKSLTYLFGTRVMKDQTTYNPHNNRLDESGTLRDLTYVDSYDETDATKTELWCYSNHGNISWQNYEVNGAHLATSTTDYERGAFWAAKLRVPLKGEFDVNIEMEPAWIGTEADVYVFPKGDISKVLLTDLDGKEPIGHINGRDFDNPIQTAGSVTIDRGGDFYVVFKFATDNPRFDNSQHHSFQIKSVELKAAPGPFESVALGIETLDGEGDALYFNAYRKVSIDLCGANGMVIDSANEDYVTINDISISTDKEGVAALRTEGGSYYVETNEIAGEAELTVDLTYRGKNVVTTFPFVVADVGKTSRTIYSDEMIANAHENIEKYAWARAQKNTVTKRADEYVALGLDTLWDAIPSQEIPRSVYASFYGTPSNYVCHYCQTDLLTDYGMYPFRIDTLKNPWKIKCPECSRSFPSNDFGKFYELGRTRDNEGKFERITALENHRAMLIEKGLLSDEALALTSPGEEYSSDWYLYYGYGVEGGYLCNDLYPEVGNPSSGVKFATAEGLQNGDAGAYKTIVPEAVERWGVDDGRGYNSGRVYESGVREFHVYIPYYAHNGIFDVYSTCFVQEALNKLGEAYLYTGNEKYGIAGAVILDRIADNYPDYDFREFYPDYWSSHGGVSAGKATGRIRESYVAEAMAKAYDVFYPMFEHPEVVEFLHTKALEYNMENDKATATKIRQNIEDGVCREIFEAAKTAQIEANFGIHQWTIATTAAALDHKTDTAEMIDWLYAASRSNAYSMNTGGEIETNLVNTVYRDGQNFESPIYNQYTVNDLMEAAIVLNRYKQNGGEMNKPSIFEHAKYLSVVNSFRKLTLLRRGTKTMADSGTADLFNHVVGSQTFVKVYNNIKDIETPDVKTEAIKVAQQLYMQSGEKLKEMHYDIWTKNPESLYNEILSVVEEHGDGPYEKSTIMTGYGFGALRDGAVHDTVGITGVRDTTRDFTLNFSGHLSHQHNDFLDLGMEAYGIGMTTDLGYPEEAVNADPHSAQWSGTTFAHNTVTVNEAQQSRPSNTPQEPLHFDAKDTRVKVMDARTPDAYPSSTDEYRRTIVMIDFDDEVSYGVDFFRVIGGKDHAYTFGPNTNDRPMVSENLEGKFVKQIDEPQDSWISDKNHYPTSSYAGPTVQFGWDPNTDRSNVAATLKFPKGYTWMFNVERADNPGVNEFWVDYQIEDFRNGARNPNLDVRLRLTMVNDFDVDEITFASSLPQRKGENEILGNLERLLVRRKGEKLDSLFTTVYEPYREGNRYVKEITSEGLTVEKLSGEGTVTDAVKAVKVILEGDRVDYVVYASNKDNTYKITDTATGYSFEFAGFVGVWTINGDGENIYSYLNDGTLIGEGEKKVETTESVVAGTVVDFQKELSLDNWVDVEFNRDLTEEEAEGLVDRMIDIDRDRAGNSAYVIEGITMTGANTARIDLDTVTPIEKYVDEMDFSKGFVYDIEEGRSFEIAMSYEMSGNPVFDEVGDKTISVGSMISVTVNATPVTEDLTVSYRARTLPRGATFDETTATFSWKPSTTQLGNNLVAIDAIDSAGRTSTIYFEVEVFGSTGGGGGGGGATLPPKEDEPKEDPKEEEPTVEPDEPTTEPDTPAVDVPTETKGFVDLGNHAWATDAINYLADEGIIKGTSETTFAPQSNITRADYALLLVRAFKLSSENEENFADVAASDYFAKELAIARNTGLVGGIGDNKYAPKSTITRQDMMVILYRALTKLGVELKAVEGVDATAYADYADVADYAKEAVKALIEAGLVNGKNGLIAGSEKTTRAEVAVLLKRVLDYVSK